MLDRGFKSLDEILCDPDLSAQFDAIASQLAPGFSSLEYRWGAIKLSKESKRARARARVLSQKRIRAPFSEPIEAAVGKLANAPESAGIYAVFDRAGKRPLYVGESLVLRTRLQQQFQDGPLQIWKGWASELSVRYYTAASEKPLLLANQWICIRKYEPQLNLPISEES
jgi:hypothetical protein